MLIKSENQTRPFFGIAIDLIQDGEIHRVDKYGIESYEVKDHLIYIVSSRGHREVILLNVSIPFRVSGMEENFWWCVSKTSNGRQLRHEHIDF